MTISGHRLSIVNETRSQLGEFKITEYERENN